MTDIETDKALALEALEHMYSAAHDVAEPAITAIKEALAQPEHGWTSERIAGMSRLKEAQDKKLAQPEQEPVAWATQLNEYAHIKWGAKRPEYPMVYEFPLYTAPPAQRNPLTDEEIESINVRLAGNRDLARLFARAIEAAHGIKEGT